MSEIDRSNRYAPKLIIGSIIVGATLVIGLGAIRWGFSKQIQYEWHSDERSAEYSSGTYGPAYYACIRLPRENQTNCIAKANDEYRKNARDEQDLIAQQTTAVWTFLMGCAAIIGIMLSSLGVFFVWTTFRETKRSADIAHEQLALTNRPTIRVHRVDIATSSPKLGDEIFGRLKITNVGGQRATFHTAAIWLYWVQGRLPMDVPYAFKIQEEPYMGMAQPLFDQRKENTALARKGKIRSGKGMSIDFKGIPDTLITDLRCKRRFMVMGYIDYYLESDSREPDKTAFRTSFCREYAPNGDTWFSPVNNLDYEHEG